VVANVITTKEAIRKYDLMKRMARFSLGKNKEEATPTRILKGSCRDCQSQTSKHRRKEGAKDEWHPPVAV